MSKQEKYAYLLAIAQRYAGSGRVEKGRILDEYCRTTQTGRKHAIKRLRFIKRADVLVSGTGVATQAHANSAVPKARTGRPPRYAADPVLFAAIHAIWESAKRPCSKRLVALLPVWLPHYEKDCGVLLPRASRALLKSISAASIDRLLAATRKAQAEKARGLSGTTPASQWLRSLVPVRTHHHSVDRPGSVEGDTVAHCGGSIAGEFFWTLTVTDIYSAWTECAGVWSKLATGIKAAIISMQARLPFALCSFDSDNGTEFINHGLHLYFANHRPVIEFTRSRPYEKNDQAYVEQKNNSVVRQFLGYGRLDNPALEDRLTTFFTGCWRDYVNFFLPTLKLLRKETVGSKTRRIYEPKAQTPYQRLMKCKHISRPTKKALRLHYETLNPFELKRQIDDTLRLISKNARYADL